MKCENNDQHTATDLGTTSLPTTTDVMKDFVSSTHVSLQATNNKYRYQPAFKRYSYTPSALDNRRDAGRQTTGVDSQRPNSRLPLLSARLRWNWLTLVDLEHGH